MSNLAQSCRLVGFADPLERALGFLVPVFRRDNSNELWVERAGLSGVVEAFIELTPQDAPIIWGESQINRESRIGSPSHWAFAFTGKDVLVGQGLENRDALKARLESEFFANKPLLAIEVSEFLELKAERLAFAATAFNLLSKISPNSANRWRDLSILTPDLRAKLQRLMVGSSKLPPTFRPQNLVAHVEDHAVRIRGLESINDRAVALEFIGEIVATLSALRPLYEGGGWTVHFETPSKVKKRVRRIRPSPVFSVLIYVADDDVLDAGSANEKDVDGIRYFSSRNARQFIVECEKHDGPTFILFGLEAERKAISVNCRNRLGYRPIGLALRSNVSSPLTKREEFALNRYSFSTAICGGRLALFKRSPSRVLPGEAKDAVKFLTALVKARGRKAHLANRSFFVRAQGVGPDSAGDAWTQIFGRSWRLGFAQPKGFRSASAGRSLISDRVDLAKVILPYLSTARMKGDEGLSGSPETHAAALISDNQSPLNHKFRDYSDVVWRVIRSQGWQIEPGQEFPEQGIKGVRGGFDLIAGVNSRKRRGEYSIQHLLEQDLSRVTRLVATEEAGPAAMLSSLQAREGLLVTLRDLSYFRAEHATVWTLIAAQLRRLNRPILSPATPARTHYLALVLQAAIQRDHVDLPYAQKVVRALHRSNLGTQLIIGCSNLRHEGDRAIVNIKMIDADTRAERFQFQLEIGDDGPSITEFSGTDL